MDAASITLLALTALYVLILIALATVQTSFAITDARARRTQTAGASAPSHSAPQQTAGAPVPFADPTLTLSRLDRLDGLDTRRHEGDR